MWDNYYVILNLDWRHVFSSGLLNLFEVSNEDTKTIMIS